MPSEADEFIEQLRPLQAALEGYCRRALVNAGDVEDVLQSAIFHAFKNWDRFQAGTNFKAWIFKFVTYECLNANRRARKVAPLDDDEVAAPPDSLRADYDALLSQPQRILEHCGDKLFVAVTNLNESERSVFLLRALGDFSYKEIAELLNLPMGSVMGYLFRARQRLRAALCAETPRVKP